MAKVERNSYYIRDYAYKKGEVPVPNTHKFICTKIEGANGGDYDEAVSAYTITFRYGRVTCDCPANWKKPGQDFKPCRHVAIFLGWYKICREAPEAQRPKGVVYYNTEDKTYYEIPITGWTNFDMMEVE